MAAAEHTEYRVIALKYRPQVFADVVGQQAVVRQLQGEIKDNRVGHAYLFTGPRGVGKTSMARIFAKALNCVEGPTPNPCGRCVHCLGIANDSDLDVVEVDAATYTRKEETIELLEGIDRVAFSARYKVYIIDEVHMFSTHSFNVLLKRLEEPPPRVVFILATTNPEKIPETVISRCRRLEFDRMDTREIVGRLAEIADREGVQFADGDKDRVLEAIALASEGGMRDSQVAFDQLISLSEGNVSFETARQLLGVVESDLLHRLFQSLVERRTVDCLLVVNDLVEKGRDLQRFIKTFTGYLRDALLAKAGAPEELMKVSRANPQRIRDAVAKVSMPQILNMMQQFLDLEARMKGAAPARFLLEFALMKLTAIHPTFVLDAMDAAKLRESQVSEPPSGSGAGDAVLTSGPSGNWQQDARLPSMRPAAAPVMHDRGGEAPAAPVVVLENEDAAPARILGVPPPAAETARFIQEAGARLPSLASIIAHCLVEFEEPDTMNLLLSPADRIMRPKLERPDIQSALASIARSVFQRSLRLRISVASEQTGSQIPASAPPRSERMAPSTSAAVVPVRPQAPPPPERDAEEVRPERAAVATSFKDAMARFPDFREVVELAARHLGTEPLLFDGRRIK